MEKVQSMIPAMGDRCRGGSGRAGVDLSLCIGKSEEKLATGSKASEFQKRAKDVVGEVHIS